MILDPDGGREWQPQLLSSSRRKVVMRILGEHGLVLKCWARSGSTCGLGLLKRRKAFGAERSKWGVQIKVVVPARPQRMNRVGRRLGRRPHTGECVRLEVSLDLPRRTG